jgi:hypothetical protein
VVGDGFEVGDFMLDEGLDSPFKSGELDFAVCVTE